MQTVRKVPIPKKPWKRPTAKQYVNNVTNAARRIENRHRLIMPGQAKKIDTHGRKLLWGKLVSLTVPDKMIIKILTNPKHTTMMAQGKTVGKYLYHKYENNPKLALQELEKLRKEVKARKSFLINPQTHVMTPEFEHKLDEVAYKKRIPKKKQWQYSTVIDHHITVHDILWIFGETQEFLEAKKSKA